MTDLKEIIKYDVTWDIDQRRGYIRLVNADNEVFDLEVKRARDLHLLVHLLQTEKPIFYNSRQRYLSTAMEPIGEESAKVKTKKQDTAASSTGTSPTDLAVEVPGA